MYNVLVYGGVMHIIIYIIYYMLYTVMNNLYVNSLWIIQFITLYAHYIASNEY